MTNWITGVIALAGVIVFLGEYAYKIGSWPLTIFIIVVLAAPVYDFYRSIRARRGDAGDNGAGNEGDTVSSRRPGTMRETDSGP